MIFFVDTSDDSEFNKGDYPVLNYIRELPDSYFLLNYMSSYSIGDKLDNLIPTYEMGVKFLQGKEEEFESDYLNYILFSKDQFLDIMEIMMSEYYGGNVIVLTDLKSPIIQESVDIIISFINKRYGESPIIVKAFNDFIECKEDTGMSVECYNVFMRDKEFYSREIVDPNELLNNINSIEKANEESV